MASNQYEMDSLEHVRLLIKGCINGNRKSQNQLYKMLKQKMLIVCLHYSDNRAEAEEILQEGFIKMFEFIHQYKFNGSIEGCVRKIMVNCALQRSRNKREMQG